MNPDVRSHVALRVLAFAFSVIVFLLMSFLGYAQSSRNMSGVDRQHAISVTSELVVLPVKVTDAKGN